MNLKRHYVSPLDVLHMSKSALRQTNNWKAVIFAVLSVLWSFALGLGPIALGIRAAVVSRSFWPALWVPLVVYLVYSLYLAFWPISFSRTGTRQKSPNSGRERQQTRCPTERMTRRTTTGSPTGTETRPVTSVRNKVETRSVFNKGK